MRRLLASVLLAGALAAALWAADQPAESPPQQTTQIVGDVPDLVGHWLLVSRIEIPHRTDLARTIASLWDVTAPGGTMSVTVLQVELPKAIQDELEKANAAVVAENFIDPRKLPNLMTELTDEKLPANARARFERMLNRNKAR